MEDLKCYCTRHQFSKMQKNHSFFVCLPETRQKLLQEENQEVAINLSSAINLSLSPSKWEIKPVIKCHNAGYFWYWIKRK